MTTELLAKRHGVNDKVIGALGENDTFSQVLKWIFQPSIHDIIPCVPQK